MIRIVMIDIALLLPCWALVVRALTLLAPPPIRKPARAARRARAARGTRPRFSDRAGHHWGPPVEGTGVALEPPPTSRGRRPSAGAGTPTAPAHYVRRVLRDYSLRYSDPDPIGVAPRMFAHVNSSGVLDAASPSVESAGRSSKGQYYVRFNRSLRGCVAVASVGFGFGSGVVGPRE